jgi:hypothetical protein
MVLRKIFEQTTDGRKKTGESCIPVGLTRSSATYTRHLAILGTPRQREWMNVTRNTYSDMRKAYKYA